MYIERLYPRSIPPHSLGLNRLLARRDQICQKIARIYKSIIFVFLYSGPYQTRMQSGNHSLSQWMWGKNSKEGCKCMHAGVVLLTGDWD